MSPSSGTRRCPGAFAGSTSSADEVAHHLALGDELTGDRPWLGTEQLVAIDDRAPTTEEIAEDFLADVDRLRAAPGPAQVVATAAASSVTVRAVRTRWNRSNITTTNDSRSTKNSAAASLTSLSELRSSAR